MHASRLNSNDAMIVAAGDDAHESPIAATFHRERPPIRRKGKHANHYIDASCRRFTWEQTGSYDFRLGEADGRDRCRLKVPGHSGNLLGNHLPLSAGLVRKHWLPDEIAYRPNVPHRGPTLIVDPYEGTLEVDRHVLKTPSDRSRPAANRDKNRIDRQIDL